MKLLITFDKFLSQTPQAREDGVLIVTHARKELEIIGNMNVNHKDVKRAVVLVASGRVDVDAIATHVLPIEKAQQGMELASTKDDGAVKVTLSFNTA